MSQLEKLEQKLRRIPPPADFTWSELLTLMSAYGFTSKCKSGSHYTFYNAEHQVTAKISKKHPGSEILRYQVRAALEAIDTVKDAQR